MNPLRSRRCKWGRNSPGATVWQTLLLTSFKWEGVRSRTNHEPEDQPESGQPPFVARGGEGAGSKRPAMILKVLLVGLEDFFIYGHVMLSEAKHLVLRKQPLHWVQGDSRQECFDR